MQDDLIRSTFSRVAGLAGTLGRFGFSMVGEKTLELLFGADIARKDARLVENTMRLVEVLGRMKGAPMKLGQMLSLHEGFLPREVTAVLSLLQKESPSLPYSTIRAQIEKEVPQLLPDIEHIEEEAFAAASIGQVHRAFLKDGREIAVKVQYPEIDKIIRSDMKTLKGTLGSVLSRLIKVDLGPFWEELEDRLYEELDFEKEAQNNLRALEIYNDPRVVIPAVLPEYSSMHIITMQFETGMNADEASKASQELRNQWGDILFTVMLDGMFRYRFLHADPNFGNFAFREDGTMVIYDFGCMKEVPETLSKTYCHIGLVALDGDINQIPELLQQAGIQKFNGEKLSPDFLKPHLDLFREMLPDETGPFGKDPKLYTRLMELARTDWRESFEMDFPPDAIFIHRTIAGQFGNMQRLAPQANWYRYLKDRLSSLAESG